MWTSGYLRDEGDLITIAENGRQRRDELVDRHLYSLTMIAKARVFLLELINKIPDIGTVLNLYFLPRRFVTRLTNGTEVKNIHFNHSDTHLLIGTDRPNQKHFGDKLRTGRRFSLGARSEKSPWLDRRLCTCRR